MNAHILTIQLEQQLQTNPVSSVAPYLPPSSKLRDLWKQILDMISVHWYSFHMFL